ncbi:MAG: hypothetical protein M0Z69_15125 [Actinomycetota bacterium]|nr:hypothetical protein [Actinomycetota bacterium]
MTFHRVQRLDKADAAAELRSVREAVAWKAKLLALGVAVHPGVARARRVNLTRRHLYDYGIEVPSYDIPYEVILAHIPSLGGRAVAARVRYNPDSPLQLVASERDGVVIYDAHDREVRGVEVADLEDFRELEIDGMPLSNVVQRLGCDLLGVVPTNDCIYYRGGNECRFCEIRPTFQVNRPYPRYRKSVDTMIRASVAAAGADPSIECVTYNGGQLAAYDSTVRMYVDLLTRLRDQVETVNLNCTVAVMPPDDLDLLDQLSAARLDQLSLNTEVMRPDLFEQIAPGKAAYGLGRMFRAMQHAVEAFPRGRVYSNLVYGMQSLPPDLCTDSWRAEAENTAGLEAAEMLLERNVVPIYTVYHSAGHSRIGPLSLDHDALLAFTIDYGRLVWNSGLIDRSRGSILFNICSIPNSVYNEGWLLAELEARCAEAVAAPGLP